MRERRSSLLVENVFKRTLTMAVAGGATCLGLFSGLTRARAVVCCPGHGGIEKGPQRKEKLMPL
jgi:hypothetical protein